MDRPPDLEIDESEETLLEQLYKGMHVAPNYLCLFLDPLLHSILIPSDIFGLCRSSVSENKRREWKGFVHTFRRTGTHENLQRQSV